MLPTVLWQSPWGTQPHCLWQPAQLSHSLYETLGQAVTAGSSAYYSIFAFAEQLALSQQLPGQQQNFNTGTWHD